MRAGRIRVRKRAEEKERGWEQHPRIPLRSEKPFWRPGKLEEEAFREQAMIYSC